MRIELEGDEVGGSCCRGRAGRRGRCRWCRGRGGGSRVCLMWAPMVSDQVETCASAVGAAAGEHGEDAAHVAVLPRHDGGVVFVADASDGVEVVEDGVDVFFVGGDEGGVGEEVLRVGFAVPGEVLADAAAGAGGAVADERDDELHAVLLRGGDGVVAGLEGGFVELAFGRARCRGGSLRCRPWFGRGLPLRPSRRRCRRRRRSRSGWGSGGPWGRGGRSLRGPAIRCWGRCSGRGCCRGLVWCRRVGRRLRGIVPGWRLGRRAARAKMRDLLRAIRSPGRWVLMFLCDPL